MLVEEGRNLDRLHQLSDHSVTVNTLSQAAEYYVEKMLCIPKSSEKYRNASYLLKQSYAFDFSSDKHSNPIHDFIKHIRSTVPSNQQTEMEQRFKNAITYAGTVTKAHITSPSKSTTELVNISRSLLTPNDSNESTHVSNNDNQETTSENNNKNKQNNKQLDSILTHTSQLLLSMKSSNNTNNNNQNSKQLDAILTHSSLLLLSMKSSNETNNNNNNNHNSEQLDTILHRTNQLLLNMKNANGINNTNNNIWQDIQVDNIDEDQSLGVMDTSDRDTNNEQILDLTNRININTNTTNDLNDNSNNTTDNADNNFIDNTKNSSHNLTIDKTAQSVVPYICHPLNTNTKIDIFFCIEELNVEEI